jgi:hypothetical protein
VVVLHKLPFLFLRKTAVMMADIDIDVNGSWTELAKVRSENLSRAAVAGQRQAGAEVTHQLEA